MGHGVRIEDGRGTQRLRPGHGRLARILDSLDASFLNMLEFRHPSWWQPAMYEELARRNVSFCGQSHPHLPDAVMATTPVLYYRFYGVPDLYRSPYDEGFFCATFAPNIEGNAAVQEAYVYFNNDIDASTNSSGPRRRSRAVACTRCG